MSKKHPIAKETTRSLSFFELYSQGNALEEEIDSFIHAWHAEMAGKPNRNVIQLHDFLGMSQDEYDVWVQDPDALPHILNARLEGKSIDAVIVEHFNDMLFAARATDRSSVVALKAWLESRNGRRL